MSSLACIVFVTLLHSAPAPDTIPSDTIIARYLAAIGGAETLRADTSLAFSGRYEEGAFHAVTTILSRRPNVRRVSVIGPDKFAYVEIFDGATEWEFSEAFRRPVQKDIESMTFYSDYRLVGHVRRPFRFVERNTRSGRQMNVLEWSSIAANVQIRDEAFHPPR